MVVMRGVRVEKEGCRKEGGGGGVGGSYRLLADHHPLHRLDLRHMVIIGSKLPLLDASINGDQKFSGNVLTIVHS